MRDSSRTVADETNTARRGRFARGLGAAALAASMLSSACSAQPEASSALETGESELFVNTGTIWKQLSIPVCWENPTASTAQRLGWVQDQITNTWQKFSKVKFTGWGTCPSAATTGLRLQIVDTTSNTGTLLGRGLAGVKNGVKLNLNMRAPAEYVAFANKFGAEAAVRSTVTHEFGHALGFAHEQNRLDVSGFECFEQFGGEVGDQGIGAYDKESIMRTCTIIDSASTKLSETDKIGLQAYYGHPSPAGVPKDAFIQDNLTGTAYFFFGPNVIPYNLVINRLLPNPLGPISKTFTGWPTTGTWPKGVDAALDFDGTKGFLFSGSQYLRFTKSTLKVDAGYPKTTATGWTNWPATWTGVDATIRWKDGKLYLFRGSEWVGLTGTAVDGSPKPIAGSWAIPYTSGFDYAFVAPGNVLAYFFKGSEYVAVDISGSSMRVLQGYPKPIFGNWPGVTF